MIERVRSKGVTVGLTKFVLSFTPIFEALWPWQNNFGHWPKFGFLSGGSVSKKTSDTPDGLPVCT